MHIQVGIRGALEIDDIAAEILNYVSSYGSTRELTVHFAGKYDAVQVQQALNKIHCQTAEIIKARKRALEAVEHVS